MKKRNKWTRTRWLPVMNYGQVFFFTLAVQKQTSHSSVLNERWPFKVPLAGWLCCWERWKVGHSPTLGETKDIKILIENFESSKFFVATFFTLGPPTHCLAQWQLSLHGCHWYSIFARKTWARPPANWANFRAWGRWGSFLLGCQVKLLRVKVGTPEL